MKYFKFYIISYFLILGSANAQNLVPNPSFETYTACPTGSGQIYYASPWTGPTCNSTDYLNTCNTNTLTGIHIPFSGLYYPKTGNGMAGVWIAFDAPNYREYLQSPLTTSLTSGKCYYIEFYTRLPNNYSEIAVNNIAANLSNINYPTNLTYPPGNVLNLTAHALKFGNPIIDDTLNWVKVSGIYNATGVENNIIIGNFQDDTHTDSISLKPNPQIPAYYLIDDVSVTPTDSISLPPFAGNDTTILFGDSTFLGRQLYGLNCNWYCNNVLINANISGIWVKPTSTTTYVVEQNLCGNTGYDTVTVSIGFAGINQVTNSTKVKIYPNPSKDKIYVEGKEISQITLLNLLGNEIITTKEKEINVSGLDEGVYFIKVKTAIGIYIQKVIVQL